MGAPPALSERLGPLRRAIELADRLELPVVLAWLAAGFALSRLSTRVVDWFVMTDELLYERLALSVVHFHSPLPQVHGVIVPNVNQLYPLLLASVYARGDVPGALHDAHFLNAFLMSSAAIPVYLLARRATSSRAVAYLVGLATVFVPWILYSSFLLTEVVGYPAFLWAVLAIEATTVAPSTRRDALALAGLALAILARTQFFVLVFVLPLVLLAYELSTGARHGDGRPLPRAARAVLRGHRTLGFAYAALALAGIALVAVGRVASILGTYADTLSGNLLPNGIGRSLLAHIAILAFSLAVLPFLVGAGWLLASAARPEPGERTAFTLTALVTLAALWLEVTLFDVRFGGGVVRDRYFFYVVPLMITACACALRDRSWRRRWLLVPTVIVTSGFAVAGLPNFGTLDVDTPVSDLDGYLRASVHSLEAARLTLAVGTILLAALYLRAVSFLPHRLVSLLVAVVLAAALPAETWYAYATLFRHLGTSGRPLTQQQGDVLDWVDRDVGTSPQVTMIPGPFIPGNYQASLAYWWDLEFWNESVGTAAYIDGAFEGTPSTFPKLKLSFDPRTGIANISPSRYAVELSNDARFRLYGGEANFNRNALLIDTGGSWRAVWVTRGLYDDGWTIPGVVARVRVFPFPFQVGSVLRTLVLKFETPAAGRPVSVVSNLGSWHGRISSADAATFATLELCQPAHGFTDVRISVEGSTAIYGDMAEINSFGSYRTAGVLVSSISLSGIGHRCAARR